MTKAVYYFVEIMERNGDMEYPSTTLLQTTKRKAKKDIEEYTMEWRSCDEDDWSEADQGYWSCDTLITCDSTVEVEEEDAKELVRIQQKYKNVNLGFHCNIIQKGINMKCTSCNKKKNKIAELKEETKRLKKDLKGCRKELYETVKAVEAGDVIYY